MSLTRRRFVLAAGALGAGLLAGCGRLPWQAQQVQPPRMPRLGYLALSPDDDLYIEPLRQGLREHGLVEGDNVVIEYRYFGGVTERIPDLVAELVQAPVDVIITNGNAPAEGAKLVTNTIPIVNTTLADPVGTGLIASLARPGGNLTGLTTDVGPVLAGKRLELLLQVAPTVGRVALLWDATNSASNRRLVESQDAARLLGVAVQSLRVRDLNDLDRAFEAIAREQDAIASLGGGLLGQYRTRIAAFALENRLPSVFSERRFVLAGGLMSYGPNYADLVRRAAYYVDRILKGANPADLPVAQPDTFECLVNMKTARDLGITFPNEIMLQVTDVIE
jgi:putative ABC transport system substrate-binding protein